MKRKSKSMWVSIPDCQALSKVSRELLVQAEIEGITLFAGHPTLRYIFNNIDSPKQVKALIAEVKALRPDLKVAIDHEGIGQTSTSGIHRFKYLKEDALSEEDRSFVERLRQLQLPRAYSKEGGLGEVTFQQHCRVTLSALKALGIDVIWGPCVDAHDDNAVVIGRLGRSFGHGETIKRYARLFCQIAQQVGLECCFKHFPGHGYLLVDSHVDLPEDERTEAQTQEEIQVYLDLLKEFPQAWVMMAHVNSPLSERYPTSLSPAVRQLLPKQVRTVVDCLSMSALEAWSPLQRMQMAYEAGNQIMYNHVPPKQMLRYLKELRQGSYGGDQILTQPTALL